MEFRNQVFCLKNYINEEIEYYGRFINNKKDYRSTMIKILNELNVALRTKINEIYQMSENDFIWKDDLLGEALGLFKNLNYHNKLYFKLLKDCFESSKKILCFLKYDVKKLISYRENLNKK